MTNMGGKVKPGRRNAAVYLKKRNRKNRGRGFVRRRDASENR